MRKLLLKEIRGFGYWGEVERTMSQFVQPKVRNHVRDVVFEPVCYHVWDVVANKAEDVVWDETHRNDSMSRARILLG